VICHGVTIRDKVTICYSDCVTIRDGVWIRRRRWNCGRIRLGYRVRFLDQIGLPGRRYLVLQHLMCEHYVVLLNTD
jgi:hypothetical protein